MGKDLCKINIKSVKMYSLIDKLVKIQYMFLSFLVLVIFVILALLALLKNPEIGRNSCLRHAIGNYFKSNDYFL